MISHPAVAAADANIIRQSRSCSKIDSAYSTSLWHGPSVCRLSVASVLSA